MTDRFVMIERPAACGDGAILVAKEAELAAVGTGVVAIEGSGLLSGGGFQGAGGQTTHGDHSDLFHSVQIDIGSWPLFSSGLFADDFAPASREFVDGVEVLLSESTLCHLASLLEVASNRREELLLAMLDKRLSLAKQVLHPGARFCADPPCQDRARLLEN